MFADLDETIRDLLVTRVPLSPEVDVSFEAPDRDWQGRWSGRPTVNCFLYDVRENLELRESEWSVERTHGRAALRSGPLFIDSTYHLTVWARVPEDEHHLLWSVLSTLIRHRVIPPEMLKGDLSQQPAPVRAHTAQPNQTRSNPADFWQAVDNRIRPGLSYVVTLALDPELQTVPRELVSTRVLHVADSARRPLASLLPTRPELRDEDDFTRIGGRVVDKTGSGVQGVTVRLGAHASVQTDVDGQFTIRRVPWGENTLVVRGPGEKRDRRVKLHVHSPTYDIQL